MIPDPDIHSLAGRFRNLPDLGRILPHAGISMLFRSVWEAWVELVKLVVNTLLVALREPADLSDRASCQRIWAR